MQTNQLDLRLADCMDVMRQLPDKHFKLAVVDPPYGIDAPKMDMGNMPGNRQTTAHRLRKKAKFSQGSGKLKNRALNTMALEWDIAPPPGYFAELRRVSEHQIIWGGNYFDLPPTRCIICWDKQQPWENFSQWEMAWTSYNKPAKMVRISNTGGANAETKIHPTQKPVKLYDWIFQQFTEPGDRVLDTHLGSGSIAIAAFYAGVKLTGCEISQQYYEAAMERIERETIQKSLF